jgi:hypothetical protein
MITGFSISTLLFSLVQAGNTKKPPTNSQRILFYESGKFPSWKWIFSTFIWPGLLYITYTFKVNIVQAQERKIASVFDFLPGDKIVPCV